jgi:FKBP-type peptidyl-prolyl cis-trans isomerase (trigger factor)
MSLSKKEQIDEFVEELDNKIQQLEDYETPYETEVNEIVLENLNDETILEIQKRYIDEQTDNIFKMIKSDGKLSQLLQNANDRAIRAKEKLDSRLARAGDEYCHVGRRRRGTWIKLTKVARGTGRRGTTTQR